MVEPEKPDFLKALALVLDLASQNASDHRDKDLHETSVEQQIAIRHFANLLRDMRKGRVRKSLAQYNEYERTLVRKQLEIRFLELMTDDEMNGADTVDKLGELSDALQSVKKASTPQ